MACQTGRSLRRHHRVYSSQFFFPIESSSGNHRSSLSHRRAKPAPIQHKTITRSIKFFAVLLTDTSFVHEVKRRRSGCRAPLGGTAQRVCAVDHATVRSRQPIRQGSCSQGRCGSTSGSTRLNARMAEASTQHYNGNPADDGEHGARRARISRLYRNAGPGANTLAGTYDFWRTSAAAPSVPELSTDPQDCDSRMRTQSS